MATTIQVSEQLRRELKVMASQHDLSYEELLSDLIEVFDSAAPFRTEEEFGDWFEDNIDKFGFQEIIKKRGNASPDYRVRDEHGEVKEVELELVGKNFVSHGHDPEDTDLIICLFSRTDTIEGVPVLAIVDSDSLKNHVIDRPNVHHTTISLPRTLLDEVERLIDETGFQNPSEFTKFVLRDIVSQGAFDSPEGYGETVQHIRTRLRNLGYLQE